MKLSSLISLKNNVIAEIYQEIINHENFISLKRCVTRFCSVENLTERYILTISSPMFVFMRIWDEQKTISQSTTDLTSVMRLLLKSFERFSTHTRKYIVIYYMEFILYFVFYALFCSITPNDGRRQLSISDTTRGVVRKAKSKSL